MIKTLLFLGDPLNISNCCKVYINLLVCTTKKSLKTDYNKTTGCIVLCLNFRGDICSYFNNNLRSMLQLRNNDKNSSIALICCVFWVICNFISYLRKGKAQSAN